MTFIQIVGDAGQVVFLAVHDRMVVIANQNGCTVDGLFTPIPPERILMLIASAAVARIPIWLETGADVARMVYPDDYRYLDDPERWPRPI